jgi:ABC-type maltose transport system permease subunit
MESSAQGTAKGVALPAAPAKTQTDTKRFTMNRRRRGIVVRQIFVQLFLLLMLAFVLFPVMWIVSMAVDPRGISRPTDLVLIPPNANLNAFVELLTQPLSNVLPLYFGEMLMNSLFIALGVSVFTVVLGSSAAYSFSRFRFRGRQGGMLMFIVLLLLPATGTIIPLYIIFSQIILPTPFIEFFPSIFAGLLVGAVIFLIYRYVKNLGKKNPERLINVPPLALAIGAAVGMLIVIFVTVLLLFTRSDLYRVLIGEPLAELNTLETAANEAYLGAQESADRRENTATIREGRAAEAQDILNQVSALSEGGASNMTDEEWIAALEAVVTARQNLPDAAEDILLYSVTNALAQYQVGGRTAAVQSFEANIATAQAAYEDVQESATAARGNADEAQVTLADAVRALAEAQAQVTASAGIYYNIRNNAIIAITPILLLIWVGALAVGAVIWLVVRLLRNVIAPSTSITILMLALAGALITWITLNTLAFRVEEAGSATQPLRTSLLGLSLAFASGGLPFAIWNLKGYFDTIPRDLEEAALIDGAGRFSTFMRVMVPLAMPAFAIVILFSFMNGWTEFILSWVFLTGETQNYTLAMGLATFTNGANAPPPDMQKFAALAILISLPVLVLFFAFQRFIVGGLSIGGVKG